MELKALRPKGQKVNSGLKPIRGKQESRSQKRLPLSCFFGPAVLFAERIKSSKKYRKQSKKFVFITILVILCIIRDLSGERSAFQNIRGGEKGQSEDTAFLSVCSVRSVISRNRYARRQSAFAPCLFVFFAVLSGQAAPKEVL